MLSEINKRFSKLEFFFVIIGALLVGFMYISLFTLHQNEIKKDVYAEVCMQLQTIDELKKHKLRLFFQYRALDAEMLAKEFPLMKTSDLEYFAKKNDFENILIVDPNKMKLLYSLNYSQFIKKPSKEFNALVSNTFLSKKTNIGDLQLSVFRPDGASLYIATPIKYKNHTEKVLVLGIKAQKINDVLAYNPNILESYKAYAVGEDFGRRTDSRLEKNATAVASLQGKLPKIDNENIRSALAGKNGCSLVKDYRGIAVLSAYTMFRMGDCKWVLLSEVDESSILNKLNASENSLHLKGVPIVLFVYIFSILIMHRITKMKVITPFIKLYNKTKGFQEIIENSLNEIYIFNLNNLMFEYANKKALENIGYTLDELCQRTPYDIKPKISYEKFLQLIQALLSKKTSLYIFETTHKRKDGSTYDVVVNLQIIQIEGVKKFVAIINDISDKKAAIKEKDHYYNIATHDYLTGIYNRQKFDQFLNYEQQRLQRYGGVASLLLFDIDHFKDINDTYGHDIGDKVLKELTSLVKENLRDSDRFARWGGEEFVILMVQTDLELGVAKAKELCRIIEEHRFEKVEHVTCSFGVSKMDKTTDLIKLFQEVDEALYRAKESGRNNVKFHEL